MARTLLNGLTSSDMSGSRKISRLPRDEISSLVTEIEHELVVRSEYLSR